MGNIISVVSCNDIVCLLTNEGNVISFSINNNGAPQTNDWGNIKMISITAVVITSYSIHYTKLYDGLKQQIPHQEIL